MTNPDIEAIAREMLEALDSARTVEPPTERYPDLDFSTAYQVAREATRLRVGRGERPIGRKIGYTNRDIWAQYNVDRPIWDHVYEHTVQRASDGLAVLPVRGMVAPRIEPEIAFKLRGPVPEGCNDPAVVLGSIEWVARSFEVVDCHYADWKFSGPDSVIDFSHHAALIVGEPRSVVGDLVRLADSLHDCRVTLSNNGELVHEGTGANALAHPLLALAHVADVVASQAGVPMLEAGEIITTGTLTPAMPVALGETWTTITDGLPMAPLSVRFE